MMIVWCGMAVAWMTCGWLCYGITFAYYQMEWPTLATKYRKADMVFAAVISLLGPSALIAAITFCGPKYWRYGWRVK